MIYKLMQTTNYNGLPLSAPKIMNAENCNTTEINIVFKALEYWTNYYPNEETFKFAVKEE